MRKRTSKWANEQKREWGKATEQMIKCKETQRAFTEFFHQMTKAVLHYCNINSTCSIHACNLTVHIKRAELALQWHNTACSICLPLSSSHKCLCCFWQSTRETEYERNRGIQTVRERARQGERWVSKRHSLSFPFPGRKPGEQRVLARNQERER